MGGGKKTPLLLFVAKFLEIRSLILQAVVRGQPSRTPTYHLSRTLSKELALKRGNITISCERTAFNDASLALITDTFKGTVLE